jgi:hypothetical protein
MWITALSFRLFGISEISFRAFGALCAVATVWLTFEIGRRLVDDWGGFFAAIVLLTNGYFLYIGRFGSTDMPLTCCLALVAYGYLRVRQGNPRWWYAVAAAMGIAIMIKGAAAADAPLALCLALAIDRRLHQLRSRQLLRPALLACAIVLPWHLAMLVQHGRVFLNQYIGYQVVTRATSQIEGHAEPAYFYLLEYWNFFLLFALLALVGLFLHLKGQRNSSIVVSFALVVTVAFSLAGTKLYTYVVPAFPFIALLAMLAVRRLLTSAPYILMSAAILFPLYWFFQTTESPNPFQVNYSASYIPPGPIASRNDPLMRLLMQANASAASQAPTPLIVCFNDLLIEKQQLLFYSGRPVVETFFGAAPDDSRESPYWNPMPLAMAVGPGSYPVILPVGAYRELAFSGRYTLQFVAQDGPLILGQIARQ